MTTVGKITCILTGEHDWVDGDLVGLAVFEGVCQHCGRWNKARVLRAIYTEPGYTALSGLDIQVKTPEGGAIEWA